MHKSYMTSWGHNDYRVSSWDSSVGCFRESASMSYWAARQAVGEDNCPGAHGGACRCESHQHYPTRARAASIDTACEALKGGAK